MASPVKQLKSKDPQQRIAAIKAVAKAMDESALRQLAIMAGDDPDPAVKELAKKAGAYILKNTRGYDVADENAEADPQKKGKSAMIPIDPKRKEQATRAVNAAFSATQQGQNGQASALLAKAVKLDPNLRYDSFFISLCEGATGLEEQAALKAIHDVEGMEARQREVVQTQAQKSLSDHLQTVEKATWRDALISLGLTALVALIGAGVVLFIAMQTAQSYHNGYETNQEEVALARAEGRYLRENGEIVYQDGYEVFLVAEQEPPGVGEEWKTFTDMRRTYNEGEPYWAINEYWREFGFLKILLVGVALAALMALGTLIGAFITNLLAGMLGGKGSLPHYLTVANGIVMNRAVIFAGLAFVSALMYFNGGSNGPIFLVVLGLFVALNALLLALKVGGAYRVNPAAGIIAGLAGIVLAAGIIGGGLWVLPL